MLKTKTKQTNKILKKQQYDRARMNSMIAIFFYKSHKITKTKQKEKKRTS